MNAIQKQVPLLKGLWQFSVVMLIFWVLIDHNSTWFGTIIFIFTFGIIAIFIFIQFFFLNKK